MGNDIGCQVCSSQEVALYELDMTNSSKVKPQKLNLDKEIIISKLRKLQIFSLKTITMYDPHLLDQFSSYKSKEGQYFGLQFKDGIGIMKFNQTEQYFGEWQNQQIDGKGLYIMSDDSFYVGQWLNNAPHGQGVYFTSKFSTYAGQWESGYLKGICLILTPLFIYQGELQKSKRHGIGKMSYNDGSWILSNWKNDQLDYFGIIQMHNYEYFGYFQKDKKQGEGQESIRNKETYIGEFDGDIRHGNGKLINGQNENEWVESVWINGKKEGIQINEKNVVQKLENGKVVKEYKHNLIQTKEVQVQELNKQKQDLVLYEKSTVFTSSIDFLNQLVQSEIEFIISQQSQVK